MRKQKQNLIKYVKKNSIIIVISLIFGIIMSGVALGGDDVALLQRLGKNIIDWWKYCVETYFTWSSRLLVNFIWFVVLKTGIVGRFIYCLVSMYVLLYALESLFNKRKDSRITIFIAALVLSFPFDALTTAGWVATTTSYFGPQAFAIASFIPIKKIFNNENIKIGEFLFYCVCVIYGANTEQMCVVLFGCFSVALIYVWIIKKNDFRLCILYALTILSLLNTFVCPGNTIRSVQETSNWFPTYGMLDMIDKADIGLSTTLKWLFVDGKAFILFSCAVMTVLIWMKYKELLFRLIALIPTVAVLSFGLLKNGFAQMFPYASYATNPVDYYGAFTVAASGTGIGMIQFGIFLSIAMCICIEVILLNDSVQGLLIDMTLIMLGVASRAMMGFSPTIYASSTRTCTTLVLCIMTAMVHIYSNNISSATNKFQKCVEQYIMWGMILLGFINLIFLVGTTFH